MGDSGHSTLHPASSQVTWAAGSAVAAGGCQHPRPRGAPAQAPTLPPSQALTLGRGGGGGRGSETLEGPAASRGPSLLFHKPGPSQEQCGTRNRRNLIPARSPESRAGRGPGHGLPGDPGAQRPGPRPQPGHGSGWAETAPDCKKATRGPWAAPGSGAGVSVVPSKPEEARLGSVSPPAPEPDSDQNSTAGGVRSTAQPGALAALGTLPHE